MSFHSVFLLCLKSKLIYYTESGISREAGRGGGWWLSSHAVNTLV